MRTTGIIALAGAAIGFFWGTDRGRSMLRRATHAAHEGYTRIRERMGTHEDPAMRATSTNDSGGVAETGLLPFDTTHVGGGEGTSRMTEESAAGGFGNAGSAGDFRGTEEADVTMLVEEALSDPHPDTEIAHAFEEAATHSGR